MLKTSPLSANLQTVSENPYPFPTIWINGRTTAIEKIVQGDEQGTSPFESTTFDFIRAWLSGKEAFEIRTSGSTGNPKTIFISRNQMIASAWKTAQKIGLQKNTSALICLDTKYIGGMMMLARSLIVGLRIVAVEPGANPLIKIPVDKCVQFTAFVPYQISVLLESKHPHLLNNPDKVFIGGAPLSLKVREQLDHYQCQCYETYGMTETVSHVALRLVNTQRKQPYFETLPGIAISTDARGCLVVSADYLPEPVITNDVVEIIDSGRFLWLGRWDSVINSGGVKVIPEKIEKVLEVIFHEHYFHHRFFIAAWPDEKLGDKIVLILEGVQFSSEILGQSLAALKSAVSPYEFPKAVYSIPEFIMTETQKIHRRQTLAGITPLLSSI
jgi:O-succinylbenzoic acid--CoA ligase